MKLRELTESQIKAFAGSTIFNRGYKYFQDGMVNNLDYNPNEDFIHAEVSGSYGDYHVEIGVLNDDLDADCDCPYDGYPCKHIVAALLMFVRNLDECTRSGRERRDKFVLIEEKIMELPKTEVVQMVVNCARRYPDFERELTMRFHSPQTVTVETLLKQIAKTIPSIQSRSQSLEKIIKDLTLILMSVDSAPEATIIETYWAAADAILGEMNELGMDDESLEELLEHILRKLAKRCLADSAFTIKKKEIIGALMDYYTWGNSGAVDLIYQTAESLCTDKADYRIVIEKLKPCAAKDPYDRTLLASLYAKVGDEEARLAALEQELKYGSDYWRLAQYWIEKKDDEKALSIVKTGIDKGEGKKTELYDFLNKSLVAKGDYEAISQLLQNKIKNGELKARQLREDPLYQALKKQYASRGDYDGQAELLKISLSLDDIDFGLFQEAEQALKADDREKFEKELLRRLNQIRTQRRAIGLGPKSSRAVEVLAEIYDHKNEMDKLFQYVKNDPELLLKYEERLAPLHPDHYLKDYSARVSRLIEQRGRENYQKAAGYLRSIKGIYQETLKQPEKWDQFLSDLKSRNKNLRALQEELSKL